MSTTAGTSTTAGKPATAEMLATLIAEGASTAAGAAETLPTPIAEGRTQQYWWHQRQGQ